MTFLKTLLWFGVFVVTGISMLISTTTTPVQSEIVDLQLPIYDEVQDDHVRHFNETQHQCMVQNLWFEARGQPIVGIYAVAWVVRNRVESTAFPKTICDVIKAKGRSKETGKIVCAFSWYCDGLSDEPQIRNSLDREVMETIEAIAFEFSSDQISMPDITEGATHFHASSGSPWWSEVYDRTVIISDHLYYRRKIK